MDANNCIIINAPMGAKAHQLGRLISSCKNVKWYDYHGNGSNPWDLYNEKDANFTKFHFNRRFNGAIGKGICEKTILPVGSKSKLDLHTQKIEINKWCKKLSPNKFVYPLHEPVELTRKIFDSQSEIFIIPDLEDVFQRFMKTSYHYFADANNKNITMGDMFNHDKEKIKAYLRNKIEDLSDNLNQNVFVVKDVAEVLDQSRFELLCKHFNLDFNLDSFSAVKNVIN
mgnify:CR=1 FL=1